MSEKFLFICGCPRSGTTALTHMFNWHPKVLLGIERYAALFRRNSKAMNKDLFSAQRFSDVRKGDCGYSSLEQMREYSIHYGRRIDLNDISTAQIVGDKITQLYEDFDVFEENGWAGESITIVQIIRNVFDVARSYEARNTDPDDKWRFNYVDGVKEWAHAIERGLHAAESNASKTRFLMVNYENLFELGEEQFLVGCNKLIEAIGLDSTPSFEEGLKKLYKHGKAVAARRIAKTALVADEEIIAQVSEEALENYNKLRALAYI